MSFSSPLFAAIAVTVIALLASTWWFGVYRRRKAEREAGVQALASMKWRECAGLVLQSLAEKGYQEEPSSRQPGDGGTEFLLVRDGERYVLGYKHGTAYRLGEANVRDFANAVQLAGAKGGILVTLGSAEGHARVLARRYEVDLIDGPQLWPQVESLVPPTVIEGIRAEASRGIERGRRAGLAGSLGLGLLAFAALHLLAPGDAGDATATTGIATAAPATAAAPPTDAASLQVEAARKALAEVENLSDEDRAKRRLAAAQRVAELAEADTAVWSTASTLVISMDSADGLDRGLVNEACAILVGYEELRFSRLQLEPPAGSDAPVRWRQCQ